MVEDKLISLAIMNVVNSEVVRKNNFRHPDYDWSPKRVSEQILLNQQNITLLLLRLLREDTTAVLEMIDGVVFNQGIEEFVISKP